jgi:Uroporphyrinogen decarboxylase (URO-D)
MTMRERMLAVLHGKDHERVPFAQYNIRSDPDPSVILGLAAPNEDIWTLVGRHNMGIIRWGRVHRAAYPGCSTRSEPVSADGLAGKRTVITTPLGRLTEERFYEPAFSAPCIRKHFVREPADYRILADYLRRCEIVEAIDDYRAVERAVADDGVVPLWVGRTPFQQLWIEWVSIEDLAGHLVDCPDLVEECVSLMTRNLRRLFEIIRIAPIPCAVFPDNITAPVIGEANFRRYCVPLYNELADILAERGIPVLAHTDGALKPLWKAIAESKLGGLESFSPPPGNDTRAAEALALKPGLRLLLNFPSPAHLGTEGEIYETAMEILREAGHSGRLQIQISENVPPGVWRKSFPIIVRAIEDFGHP